MKINVIKVKRCSDYCGLSCIDGSCPIADYRVHPQTYDCKQPTCSECGLYKGCEDCYFFCDNHCSVNEMRDK